MKNFSAIGYAVYYGHWEATRALIAHGAKKGMSFGNDRMTPLMWAAARGHFDLVKDFVEEYKAKVCSTDKFKRTPLIFTIMNGHMQIASYLL